MFVLPSRSQIERIRAMYPSGCRVELVRMDDPYTHLKAGDRGTVLGVDDSGQIIMRWDRHSSLSLIPGEDEFRRIDK